MTQKTPSSEILAQTSQKGEKWEKVNSEGKRKIDILDFIYVFPYIGYKMPKHKNRGANGLFGPAVKWAEMAADHENGQNSKKLFSPSHGHHIAS